MMITHVVAASTNHCIGKDGKLLWHLPNDMRFFKDTTWGSVVIMGRKTFESVGKPLAGRVNIVITRQGSWSCQGVLTATSISNAFDLARETNCLEVFVIGGAEIYDQSMSVTSRIYLTRVHAQIDGDTYYRFPNDSSWTLINNHDFQADEKHLYNYSIQTWQRNQSASGH